MSILTKEIDEEIRQMDPETARRFELLVRDALALVKLSRNGIVAKSTLAENLANHCAIGSWPRDLDADEHIKSVREGWDRTT